MEKQTIKQIVLDQREEIKEIFKTKIIEREIEEKVRDSLKDNLIKVIIEIRRCGKSVLSHQILKEKNYGYINFDDERLIGAKAEDLNDFLEVLKEINPDFNYLLLDEIQNVEGWELFVNRLKRMGHNLIITGSNSKLLSKELSTHLTGRHFAVELYPFSFEEFLKYKNFKYSKNDLYITENRALIKSLFGEYLKFGGFPELSKIELKEQYLRDLYDKIITRDIVLRHKIKYFKVIKEISLYLISHFGSRITYHKLKNIFEINSVHTIKNYISYLEEAYLIFQLFSFSFKLKNQLKGARKVYGIDSGLINSVSFQFSSNLGRIMENAVFLQLKRKGYEFYFYYEPTGSEVDFVIREGLKIKELIQVYYNLDDIEIREREIKSLIKAGKQLNCSNLTVITYDTEKIEKIKGKQINFIPLWKWLLS
ncbi:ATP-binding protein [Candidatus Pacearchaeota archaeon]|nr:ATP-binding protein [Candidatus Pacearchaeota archaeon]